MFFGGERNYGTTKIIRNKLLKTEDWKGTEEGATISDNLHFAEKVCSPLAAVEVLIITEKQTVKLLG